MKVSELIKLLEKCNEQSEIEISFDNTDNAPEEGIRLFGEVLGINEYTKNKFDTVTILATGQPFI